MVDLPSGLARRYLVLVNAGGAGSKPFGGDVGVAQMWGWMMEELTIMIEELTIMIEGQIEMIGEVLEN